MEQKFDDNYTRMLRAILNQFYGQHPTKQQLYGHLPPITKTVLVRRTRHAGHYWRSKDELISDILLWTPSHGKIRTTSQKLYTISLCRYRMQPGRPTRSDGRLRRVTGEGQGDSCWRYNMMMMMMTIHIYGREE